MRAARAVLSFLIVGLAAGVVFAHVGSPHIYIEDRAGPYPVTVGCEMPPAVPGEATVQVLLDDRKADEPVEVFVREIPPAGDARAPEWTHAKGSAADERFFSAPLPLMVYGLWHAEVKVTGARGEGVVRFPITAKVPVPYAMGHLLAGSLVLLTLILVASLASILIGLGRDADRGAGDVVSPVATRRGVRWALVGSGTFLSFVAMIVYFWAMFHEARAVRTGPALTGQLEVISGPLVAGSPARMRLTVFDIRGQKIANVRSDHDKMLHMAIAKVPGATWFFHIHPTMTQDGVFDFTFTPPEPGKYAYFADVLFGSGEGDTATGIIDVPNGTKTATFTFDDPDDSFSVSPPLDPAEAGNTTCDVGDGMTMAWVAGGPANLRPLEMEKMTFELRDPSGTPVAQIDPYMGMAGHMLIMRDDAKMFAHVHPTGTVAGRMGAMPRGHMAMMTDPIPGAHAAFPYAFPNPGLYRVWVQIKYQGKIRTGVFDVKV